MIVKRYPRLSVTPDKSDTKGIDTQENNILSKISQSNKQNKPTTQTIPPHTLNDNNTNITNKNSKSSKSNKSESTNTDQRQSLSQILNQSLNQPIEQSNQSADPKGSANDEQYLQEDCKVEIDIEVEGEDEVMDINKLNELAKQSKQQDVDAHYADEGYEDDEVEDDSESLDALEDKMEKVKRGTVGEVQLTTSRLLSTNPSTKLPTQKESNKTIQHSIEKIQAIAMQRASELLQENLEELKATQLIDLVSKLTDLKLVLQWTEKLEAAILKDPRKLIPSGTAKNNPLMSRLKQLTSSVKKELSDGSAKGFSAPNWMGPIPKAQ